jgi:hypothetical protein
MEWWLFLGQNGLQLIYYSNKNKISALLSKHKNQLLEIYTLT